MKAKYTKKQLTEIITDICQFAIETFPNLTSEQLYDIASDMEEKIMVTSHVVACLISQNTKYGHEGVESDIPYDQLEMNRHMERNARKKLVEKLIEGWNKNE